MTNFFAANFQGAAFELFGTTHFAALGVLVVLNLSLLRFKNASDGAQSGIRWMLAFVLLVNEIAWHYWNYMVGRWTIQTMLPLHLCSLLVWTGALMLITKNYRIYEFMYFIGIAGAIQALTTPGLGIYGFPHFVFFQYFISHGLILTSAIYMTVGRVSAYLEIHSPSGSLDEYLCIDRLFHQFCHRQQLPDDQLQAEYVQLA